MLLEAAAGKNPTSHVGKIYNVIVMPFIMAQDIVKCLEEVSEVRARPAARLSTAEL